MKFVEYSINGVSFRAKKVFIQESKGLMDKLKPKARKSYNWAEQHGEAVDLSAPKYESREIELKGWVQGENWQEMKQNFDSLLSEFDKEGLQRLIVDFGSQLVYDVYLSNGVELEKTFTNGIQVGKFTIKLIEPKPVKKVLKLAGKNLNLAFTSEDWVNVNIDGKSENVKGNVSINKTLNNRAIYVNNQGRNLMLNSKTFQMRGNDFQNSDNTNAGRITVGSSNGTWNAYAWINLSERHKVGDVVTFSIDLKSSVDCSISFNYFPYYIQHYFTKFENLSAGQWKRVSVTGTIHSINSGGDLIGMRGSNMAGAVVEFRNAKIEVGNKATDWTPAPEDEHFIIISGDIDKIKNLETNAEEIL